MRPLLSIGLRLVFFLSLVFYLNSNNPHAALQNSNLRILGPNKTTIPVVNEGNPNPIMLTVVDENGQPVTGVTFESGSPDVASVDSQTGMVKGQLRGYATITARKGSQVGSAFVVVTRVVSNSGANVPGDTKTDTGGRIYISDPTGSVILRKDGFNTEAKIFAGRKGLTGTTNDVSRLEALFNAPTAVAVDNSPGGGIYVADTANHSIRKIGFNDRVTKVMGQNMPGMNASDVTPFGQEVFRGLQGLAIDTNGNLYIADTENHTIYYADFNKKEVRLLAGVPGVAGKQDGNGRTAMFKRPLGMALSRDGRTIAVADSGNNRVRLITPDGDVSTVGRASGRNLTSFEVDQTADGIEFNEPRSVSFDGVGNIYVVDNNGASVITGLLSDSPKVIPLAQDGTFVNAISVVVNGTEVLVLDNQNSSVNSVTVGAPSITDLSKDSDRLEGGSEVIIRGKNFAPESLVVLGDSLVVTPNVVSATEIRFTVPPQGAPGTRTLSVQTRGGVAQTQFKIRPKPLSELKDGEITTVAGGIPFLGDGGSAINAGLNGPVSVTIDSTGNLFIADFVNQRIRRVDTSGVITTIAGSGRKGFGGDRGPAISASLDTPQGITLDREGNLLIVDRENHRIRLIDAKTGLINTVVGDGSTGLTGDGGPATMAGIDPVDVAVDASNNLFIADRSHSRIRRVDAISKIITTVAGSGGDFEGGFSGDGGPADKARLKSPLGVAIDVDGNLFISDGANHRIRRVDAKTGIITTIVGDGFEGEFGGGRFKGDGGPATQASLSIPSGIAVDSSGNLFIADVLNNCIRRVGSDGIISTVAGDTNFAFGGDGGPAKDASLINPEDITLDGAGNLFIADFGNDRIRRVDADTKIINTVVGIGAITFSGDGGPAIDAQLGLPRSVNLDRMGNLLIVDQLNNRIRRVDANSGIITTVAGGGDLFIGDGELATRGTFSNPLSVAADQSNNLFIADRDNHRIRRVDATTGIMTTAVGGISIGLGGDGGPATKASLDGPLSVTFDRAGNLFIADSGNHRIRRVDRNTGIITTAVGTGPPGGFETGGFGGDGGPAKDARLNIPINVAFDPADNLFILDELNFRVRRVEARTQTINTVAGGGDDFSEGIPATKASLNFFSGGGIAVDAAGNLFIADNGDHRIRRVDAQTGLISTVIGNGTVGYSGDGGDALSASLAFPEAMAIDSAGNLYITDTQNNVIRVVKGLAKGQGGQRNVAITNALFTKPNLVISGSGFGASGATVNVNGSNVSSNIVNQNDTQITLKGNKKKLNLKKGANQVTVTSGGVTSNTFVFNF